MKDLIIVFFRKRWLSIILWLLNIISVFFIVQIVFEVFPLVDSNYSLDKIDRINSLIIDCSIGILASTLFYILLVYIPERKKTKLARKVQKTYLQYLSEHMQFFILYLVKVYSLKMEKDDVQYSKIVFDEFEKVNSSIFINPPKSYPLFVRAGDSNSFVGNKVLGIKEMYGGVNDLINKILSNPIIIFEDESLIDLLNKILTCKLFKLLIISESKDSLSTDVSNSIFSSDILKLSLVEYYILYIRLLDYSLPNYFFIKEEID